MVVKASPSPSAARSETGQTPQAHRQPSSKKVAKRETRILRERARAKARALAEERELEAEFIAFRSEDSYDEFWSSGSEGENESDSESDDVVAEDILHDGEVEMSTNDATSAFLRSVFGSTPVKTSMSAAGQACSTNHRASSSSPKATRSKSSNAMAKHTSKAIALVREATTLRSDSIAGGSLCEFVRSFFRSFEIEWLILFRLIC